MDEKKLKMISNFNEWSRVTKNMYRYVTNINVCYEIIIITYIYNTDINKASACLFLAGNWFNHETKENYFSREMLYYGTVEDCIEKAVNNYIIENVEEKK